MCPLLCSESRAWSLCFQVEFPEAQGDVPPGGQAAGASGGSGSGAGDVAPAEREIGRLGGDGSSSSKPVMVPFACHVNHSPRPHCVRYGRLTPRTQTLDYPAFRPCSKGQQVYISYGPVPNLKLICFYGFAVPSNPHDLVMLQLEVRSSRLEIALLAEYRRPAPRDPPPPDAGLCPPLCSRPRVRCSSSRRPRWSSWASRWSTTCRTARFRNRYGRFVCGGFAGCRCPVEWQHCASHS